MSEIQKEGDHKVLMKWVVIPCLVLTFFWGFNGQDGPQDIYSPSIVGSVDSGQSTTEISHNHFLSSFPDVLEYVEQKEEEDDDDYGAIITFYQPPSQPLVLNERTSIPFFSHKKIIKLFILFHSWKSFLHL